MTDLRDFRSFVPAPTPNAAHPSAQKQNGTKPLHGRLDPWRWLA